VTSEEWDERVARLEAGHKDLVAKIGETQRLIARQLLWCKVFQDWLFQEFPSLRKQVEDEKRRRM
jgi:hypothetical protein